MSASVSARHGRGAAPIAVLALALAAACADEPASAPASSSRVATLDTVVAVPFQGLPTPGPSSPVAVSSDLDRIAVAFRDGSGEILVFDGHGELLRRFGRAGQGPGEFGEIGLLSFAPGSDSLWVLDRANRRASLWAPGAAEPSREVGLRGLTQLFGAAWASDTTLVVQGRVEDPPNALALAVRPGGVTPALVEGGAESLESFEAFMRPLTSSASGGLWVGHFREPELRRLDPGLSETEVLAYHAPFLDAAPENAERWAQLIDTRPAVLEMTEDAEGDLWIRFGVPADPLPAVDDPQRALAEGEFGAEDLARTVLARFASGALDRGPADEFEMGPGRGGLLPGGLAYYFDPDELGEITMTLVRLGSRETE